MPRLSWFACVFVFAAQAVCAAEKSAALFNGRDFSDWQFMAGTPADVASVCTLKPDGVIAVAGKPNGYLATAAPHRDYRLHAEWRWTGQPGNGGILLHINGGPKDRIWPACFQVQTKNKSVGDLLPMAGVTFAEPLTTAPGVTPALRAHSAADSEKPVGEWNACDIVCRGDTIEVSVNGVVQNKVTGCSLRAGQVGFQLEGVPFELRHVTLEPLR